ncbi:hypothetical protein K440DRAFT_624480 [Wilcoxina mikolae CBS 423.85]|nr:hypothetical protein K440DRAFT_624480 [Wilcoxina mikolae CBS 423.85]
MSLDLSLTPVSPDALTRESLQELLSLGIDLLTTLPERISPPSPSKSAEVTWSASKGDAETKLWKATHNNEPWITRVSNFSDIPYDVLRRGLMIEKSLSEKSAFLQENDEIKTISEEEFEDIKVLHVHKLLHVQAFSAREFIQTIISRDLEEEEPELRRSCVIVSVPKKGEIKDTSHALGAYTSVDMVREVGDGKVEVIMACCSDARGNIPRWVQNMAMPGQVLSDAQKFFKYMRSRVEF